MSIHDDAEDGGVPRLDFELSAACDHACSHCYNVWNARPGDPQHGHVTRGMLPSPECKALMTKAVAQSGARHLTLTGGEPLLRKDALDVIAHAKSLVPTVHLITNGSHVPPEVARRLAEIGITSAQLTLLAADRDLHDRLKGAACFDDTVRAILDLAEAGVRVQVCFVAMAENWHGFRSVMELCFALGVSSIAYNRMSPTGGAIHHVARLVPTIEQVESNLDTAEELGPKWGIRVSTAMPIPPCVVRIDKYSWVRLGFCSTGSSSPNIVIDGKGDVRSCNLSSNVLGNLVRQDWAEIFANPYPREFRRTVPEICRGCAYETSCQGGCKESAFATFGSLTHPEPFLWLGIDPGARDRLAAQVPQDGPPGPPRRPRAPAEAK